MKLVWYQLFLISSVTLQLGAMSYEQRLIRDVSSSRNFSDSISQDLFHLAAERDEPIRSLPSAKQPHLFNVFPGLKNSIAYIQLGDFPTPISPAPVLADMLGASSFYIKRDDVSGKPIAQHGRLFGGNKVRKLEFLLADALKHNAQTVITFGCAGSNHALATSTYARELGLGSVSVLRPQPNSHIVRRNLLLGLNNGTALHLLATPELQNNALIAQLLNHKQAYGSFPYVIPVGGSCSLGILGFVNAAFELKEQIMRGDLPEPNRIYVPVGSCGTFVGLLLGAKAAGLKSRIIGVTVEPEDKEHEFVEKIVKLFKETNDLLCAHDSTFPQLALTASAIELEYSACGEQYALFTQEAADVIQLVHQTEKIVLDGVYTGKAFAGLLQHVQKRPATQEVVLFWNTFCADSFESHISGQDYHMLPKAFHDYFETEVQALDKPI